MADRPGTKLRAAAVTKSYHEGRASSGTPVLENLSLDVGENEFLTILGPSGCGKTTLLNLFAGLEAPNSGELYIDGRTISGTSPDRGVIFQQYALFPWKTVLENVAFGLRLKGVRQQERLSTARHYIDLVGLGGFEESLPKQLSGGMKQRCAIARAYAARPEVLLMDEPFGALDAMTKVQLQGQLLETWQDDQRTVLFITHDIDEAIYLGSRTVILGAGGRIVHDAPNPLPYPRLPEVRFGSDFQDVRRALWSKLHGDSADGQAISEGVHL